MIIAQNKNKKIKKLGLEILKCFLCRLGPVIGH